jgi:NAD-dependent deacetylase
MRRDGAIVVLTGAGISAESGLPTFRGADGLWMGWRREEVGTPEAFARQPEVVQRFYDLRRRQLLAPAIAPNAAHLALADLGRRWPGPVQIVTQNIDDLHERAGSRNLVHMHGELLKARCTACAAVSS